MTNTHAAKSMTIEEYLNSTPDQLRALPYSNYLDHNDPKIRTYKWTSIDWLAKTIEYKEHIKHELSRGEAHERIVIDLLKHYLGGEEYRVVSGQVVTAAENGDVYSTQQDVIVLKKGAELLFESPTITNASPENVIAVIEVKTNMDCMTGTSDRSIESIVSKDQRINLDQDHILFGAIGFEKGFSDKNLRRGGRSLATIDDLIEREVKGKFILAASEKYFVRQYEESDGNEDYRNRRHYFFEQGLAFGYFIANVLHHIDLQDGKDKGVSVSSRFPALSKTRAQVYP